jgi:hypothetical protein
MVLIGVDRMALLHILSFSCSSSPSLDQCQGLFAIRLLACLGRDSPIVKHYS